MGGRLDGTNLIIPEFRYLNMVLIILNFRKYFTRYYRKAGIIKHKIPVIIGETKSRQKEFYR